MASLTPQGFQLRVMPTAPSIATSDMVVDTALAARLGLEGRRQALQERSLQEELARQMEERRAKEAADALARSQMQARMGLEERRIALDEATARDLSEDRSVGRRLQQENILSLQEVRAANAAARLAPRPVQVERETVYNPETGQNEIILINAQTGERMSTIGQAPTSAASRETRERMLITSAITNGVNPSPFMESRIENGVQVERLVDEAGLTAAVAEAARIKREADERYRAEALSMRGGGIDAAFERLGITPPRAAPAPAPSTPTRSLPVQSPVQAAAPQPRGGAAGMVGTADRPFASADELRSVADALPAGKYYYRNARGQLVEVTVGD